jgi:hypothetical protein
MASAGTGKSTTLKQLATIGQDKKILYIVFDREGAKDARIKFPKDNVDVTTANALGYNYILKTKKQRDLVVNDLSINSIADITGSYVEYKKMSSEMRANFGICIKETLISFFRSLDKEIQIKHVSKAWSSEFKEKVLKYCTIYWRKASKFECPITHDVYMKLFYQAKPYFKYDAIFYDEAQDADPIMLHVINRQKCQLVVVGDPYQQIYSFRGAINALEKFNTDKSYPLSQSYRYGPEVADMANRIIQYHHNEIVDIKGWELNETRVSNTAHSINSSHPQTIICRNNTSLLKLILKAYSNGDRYYAYLDKSEIKSIISSIYLLGRGDNPVHPSMYGFDDLESFITFLNNGGDQKLLTYLQLYFKYGYQKIVKAVNAIESPVLLKSNTSDLDYIFVSAHKSKGREFQNVFLADDFSDIGTKKYTKEEGNLIYVASTRALSYLDISKNKQLKRIYESELLGNRKEQRKSFPTN